MDDILRNCWAILESVGIDLDEEIIKPVFSSDNYYVNRDRLRLAVAIYKAQQDNEGTTKF